MLSLSWPGSIFPRLNLRGVGRNWGLHPQLGLELGREMLQMRGHKRPRAAPPSSQMNCVAQSPGPGRAGRGDVGKEPPSPPRLHLHGAEDGNHPECNICAGEMAEGLLQIPIIVNKSSIYPDDKSWSQRAPNEGQQLQVLLPPKKRSSSCSRMGTGEPGRCQNLSLWASRHCPDVFLPTLRMFLLCLSLFAPTNPNTSQALPYQHHQNGFR